MPFLCTPRGRSKGGDSELIKWSKSYIKQRRASFHRDSSVKNWLNDQVARNKNQIDSAIKYRSLYTWKSNLIYRSAYDFHLNNIKYNILWVVKTRKVFNNMKSRRFIRKEPIKTTENCTMLNGKDMIHQATLGNHKNI